ncbi:MAG: addiction module protein [Bacteroidales bacterium]|nr:addiction module protein [Bacteroidales bacterium]
MNAIEKRDYIYNYLYLLIDNDIEEVYNKVKSIVEKELVLSQSQDEELDRRVTRHKNGESKSYTWSELKQRVKSNS